MNEENNKKMDKCCSEDNKYMNRCCVGNKRNVVKIFSLLLIVTSVFMIFKTVGVYQENKFIGQGGVGNTMTFSGEGEVFVVPDIASFSFSVVEEAKTPSEAQALATKKINETITFLKENNIEDKDIKTTNYNVYPRYEWQKRNIVCIAAPCISPETERVLVGYEVNQSVTVKVRDTEKAGTILAGIGGLDVNNISGLNFEIDDEDGLTREARKLAIEDAKSKAGELAKDLGVKLVRIVNFSESGDYPTYYKTSFAEMDAVGMGGAIEAPQLPMGENKIISSISITYEIR